MPTAARHHTPSFRALRGFGLLAVAFLCLATLLPGAASATTNQVQLDNGTCGTNLQVGSDHTASSSATPTFVLQGDGGAAYYEIFIDGVDLGMFGPGGNVCIRLTTRLSEGSHVLTGNELWP